MSEKLIIVVKRAIPVSDYTVDTVTNIFYENDSLADVMNWANKVCGGACSLISVELTTPTKE